MTLQYNVEHFHLVVVQIVLLVIVVVIVVVVEVVLVTNNGITEAQDHDKNNF